jgi:YidC/Oxa1 family membrane protein insertase
MDRRTLIFVILLAVVFFTYQSWLGKHMQATRPAPPPAQIAVGSRPGDSLRAVPPGGAAPAAASPAAVSPAAPATPGQAGSSLLPLGLASDTAERRVVIETPLYRAAFSSLGARLVSIELKHFVAAHGASAKNGRPLIVPRDREAPPGDRVVLDGGPLFGIDLGSGAGLHPLDRVSYAVDDSVDASGAVRALTFTYQDSAGVLLRQTWRVRPETYALDLAVEMHGIPDAWRVTDYSLATRNWPAFTETDRKTDLRYQRTVSLVGKNLRRDPPHGLLKGAKEYTGAAEWAGVQSRYFQVVVAVDQGVARGVSASAVELPLTTREAGLIDPNERPVKTIGTSRLVMALPTTDRPVQRFLFYAGPSDMRLLPRLGHDLTKVVDLGWSWLRPISELLMRLLDWIYLAVRNYGLAILVLAVLARLALHPLNASSLRSMRAMQRLAPEIERLKQKYKSDAQAMNTAMMALYKENKVNPLGGCLPVVLQFPIMFALYQVLLNAIELRQAPFVSYITDLSAPDQLFAVAGFPIRLLPFLMAASGLLLTRLTPSNPQQAPTAYMMNLFMPVILYNLPSGLMFYWVVLNLMTALSQWWVLRQDDDVAVVVPAEVEKKKKKG